MIHKYLAAVTLGVLLALPGHASKTPYTPFKDGYATPSLYSGNTRFLVIRAGDSRGWVSHGLADGAGEGLIGAML